MNATDILLHLMSCALNGTTPDGDVLSLIDDDMNKQLLRLARLHSVSALAAQALEGTPACSEAWMQRKNNALRRAVMFSAERSALYAFLDENHIWHMGLKGILIQAFYPAFGLRESADNDILFDPAYQEAVRDWFVARGYQVKAYQQGAHDSYTKAPIYNFEMHTTLFSHFKDNARGTYYANVKTRLVPSGIGSELRFTDDDAYVYFVAHAYKHHDSAGTGLRTLADFYVYQRAMGSRLDWAYIARECAKLGIDAFESGSRMLAQKIFTPSSQPFSADLTVEEEKLLCQFAGSGTYGTLQNKVKKNLRKMDPGAARPSLLTKLRYLIRRAMPDDEFMKEWCYMYFKPGYRHPILRIPARFIRLFKEILLKSSLLIREIKSTMKQ